MNPFSLRSGSIETLSIALKTPFITSLGEKKQTVNVSVRLSLAGGATGYGEASGSVVLAAHTPQRMLRELRTLLKKFRGADMSAMATVSRDVWKTAGKTPGAAAAFECALTDAVLRQLRVSPHTWFGGKKRRIETDCTLSADAPERTRIAALRAAKAGFRTLKIKIGKGGGEADFERIRAADALGRVRGKRPALILDGNQKLTVRCALALLKRCRRARFKTVLIEQPLPRDDWKGMARLRKSSPVPVAADESLRSAADAVRLADMDAADVFNVKLAKTGIRETLDIMAVARAAGKSLMIGCMQESALGLTMSAHLALGAGDFSFVDLDSDVLLEDNQPRGAVIRHGRFLSL
jgi:L-alanine-DL-glutamate epimerase-like enolase superfamily enzyme